MRVKDERCFPTALEHDANIADDAVESRSVIGSPDGLTPDTIAVNQYACFRMNSGRQ